MNKEQLKKISKRLSYVLRHRPDSVNLDLEEGGWVFVDQLIDALNQSGQSITLSKLELVVAENDKQRFEFSDDHSKIRARQGHSTDVDLGYQPAAPPEVLFHGTATRFLESILQQGLIKGNRHHVHMSMNKQTMLDVGQRHGKAILLSIDAKQMLTDGHEFYVTGNQVWLTDHVPPDYLCEI
ncbi:MAG: RNA 2'-phosphotransferase [Blastopirellula sp.]|nr:MAG: RNA 2'-phosphotransferase [Blastopirellula sp.]